MRNIVKQPASRQPVAIPGRGGGAAKKSIFVPIAPFGALDLKKFPVN